MPKIITKTLAEIYMRQGHLREAYEIYRILHQKNPHDEEIIKKLDELEKKLKDQANRTSKQEILNTLTQWLENIEKRKKTHEPI